MTPAVQGPPDERDDAPRERDATDEEASPSSGEIECAAADEPTRVWALGDAEVRALFDGAQATENEVDVSALDLEQIPTRAVPYPPPPPSDSFSDLDEIPTRAVLHPFLRDTVLPSPEAPPLPPEASLPRAAAGPPRPPPLPRSASLSDIGIFVPIMVDERRGESKVAADSPPATAPSSAASEPSVITELASLCDVSLADASLESALPPANEPITNEPEPEPERPAPIQSIIVPRMPRSWLGRLVELLAQALRAR